MLVLMLALILLCVQNEIRHRLPYHAADVNANEAFHDSDDEEQDDENDPYVLLLYGRCDAFITDGGIC